ncbi:MAG TPA: M20 family peptidase [Caulobacterales bacterium]|nr:M20 family peptidase [Caulobacterales bacterium]
MWRLIGAGLAIVLAALAAFVGYRTVSFTAPPPAATVSVPDLHSYAVDRDAAAQHLAQAIRFRTVSLSGAPTDDPARFAQFHAWLARTYPAFYAAAKLEVINGNSLLFTWEGSDPAQPPLLLLAHQDVVPAPPDTRAEWRVDPFSGEIRDGVIWGRGAVDDKDSLIGLVEAADLLARQGMKPKRTIIFAFGHDEELGGSGAHAMAAALKARGVRAWFAIDEGLVILSHHPLTDAPASLIGISEKGFGTLRVVAHGQAGHSSMPPPETAVSLLAQAVTRIHAMPIDHSLENGPAMDMMRALSPQLPFTTRMAVANEWLFGPMLRQRFAGIPAANALVGTTVAPTVINGGVRENVLPAEATALINLRIHPRDHADDLLARARHAVAGLQGVTVDWAAPPQEASPVSATNTSSFALIASLSHASAPDAPVAPSLVIGATDSRQYADVAENVYRFQPVIFSPDDLEMVHGINEHISIDNFERLIRFYAGLMQAGAM